MKQIFKTNKKLLSFSFLMILPYLSMASEVLENKTLYEYQRDAIDFDFQTLLEQSEAEGNNESLVIEQKNKPKSKQELDVLLGTWILSHKEEGVTYTDRFEINEISENKKGGFDAFGKLFLNNKGKGALLLCSKYKYSQLVAYYAADYDCTSHSSAGQRYIYSIRVSGNIVTNGYYGTGDSMESSVISIMSKSMRIDGYRQSNDSQYESSYDESIKELMIPLVNYQGSKYRVIFENKGDLIFALKDAQPTVLESPQSEVVYDEKKLELVIPSLIYKKSKFRVILKETEGFVFSVKEAKPL
ncbi:MAG: hypothetical protein KAH20_01605 [Methylococcales bacterium]|nr:hypothetical protein [Methylococcales bacterium]